MSSQRYGLPLATITETTAALQNADLLASDFRVKRGDSLVRITINENTTTSQDVRLIGSDGTVLILISSLAVNTPQTVTIALDTTRTWNVQTSGAAGLSVDLLVVQEVAE